MDGIALTIGQHLELDVARQLQVLLHEHGGVLESIERFGAGDGDLVDQLVFAAHDLHAAAAATGDRLDQHRIADLPGDRHAYGVVVRPDRKTVVWGTGGSIRVV